jgi:hypothetical protein
MGKREMQEALEQARVSQSAREEDVAAEYDAAEVTLRDEKERRGAILREMVNSWVAAMTAAERPGMEIVRVQAVREAGLLRRRRERYETEVAGWLVVLQGTTTAMDSAGQRRFDALYVGADSRLFYASTYAHTGPIGSRRLSPRSSGWRTSTRFGGKARSILLR